MIVRIKEKGLDVDMKKYIFLTLITVTCLVISAWMPSWIADSRTEVTLISVEKDRHTETVAANGSIEYSSKKEVYSELPVIPEQVYVEIGDHVEVGDLLATVNIEETCTAAINLLHLGNGNIPTEVISVLSRYDTEISQLTEMIPDKIFANAGGTVTELTMVKGAVSLPTSSLAVISESEQLQARLAINEAAVPKIKVGQKVTITGSGFKNSSYSGTVQKISPTARKQYVGTTQETVVDAIVCFDRVDDRLKSGFSVKAVIETAPAQECYTLPYSCIEQDEKGEYLYVYRHGKAKKRYIETGIEKANTVEIKSGIEWDELIITTASAVRDNMFVKVSGTI